MSCTEYKNIWVYAELTGGRVSQTTLELLAKSINLKEKLGGTDKIAAVILGEHTAEYSKLLFSYGAEQVICVEDAKLAEYKPRVYKDALVKLVEKHKPSIFLFPASPLGRELAPRVMCRLGTGLTADAIDLDIDEDGTFVQTTPNFGGNILSHIAIPEKRPQMCTVHPKVFAPIEPIEGAEGELIKEELDIACDDCYEVVSTEEKVIAGIPVDKADIVVSGGFGIKSPEEFGMLKELADLIGGQIGCSRPICENGWFGHEYQIGQSGATISPKLIINVAISGSVQYMAGMDKSKCVMSINKDSNAPIFDLSNYGVVGDFRAVIPAIIEEIKNRRA